MPPTPHLTHLSFQQDDRMLYPTPDLSRSASSKIRAGCLPLHTLVSQLPATLDQVVSHSTPLTLSFQQDEDGTRLSPTSRLSLSASSNMKAGCPPLQILASKLHSVGFRASAQNPTITGGLDPQIKCTAARDTGKTKCRSRWEDKKW